jgi:hypothetical protein
LSAPDLPGQGRSADRGTLVVTFGHPAAAVLYRATRPRLRVDGVEIDIPGWGRHETSVPGGRHRVQVWVPYAIPRKAGRAQAGVAVAPGETVALDYVAPTVTFAKGSLGTPGQQPSTGYSTIMVLNVLAVVAVIAFVVAALLT